ncbi:MAG: glutamate racemase [Mollicutes bacterium]|nr:glutamate racemase [Mollicutes bacterium]
MKIGVFDSGVGGLNVLKELVKYHPNHHYIYFGDTLNVPYGSRCKDELLFLADSIIQFLINKKVDLIIIACGTISSNIDEKFKEKYKVPILDIISPTVDEIKKYKYNDVGLIATTMTIKSNVFADDIITKECPYFVPIIENNQINTPLCDAKIKEYLTPLKEQNIKKLVLGCTHYPLLEEKILNFFNNNIELINMGTVLAQRLKLPIESNQKIELYFSKITDDLIFNVKNIIGINDIKQKVIVGDLENA